MFGFMTHQKIMSTTPSQTTLFWINPRLDGFPNIPELDRYEDSPVSETEKLSLVSLEALEFSLRKPDKKEIPDVTTTPQPQPGDNLDPPNCKIRPLSNTQEFSDMTI